MEVESFENEEVAKLLNDWFVSIKVVYADIENYFNSILSHSLPALEV
jgi:uncharacterized protein YyaL (SSP411 family)